MNELESLEGNIARFLRYGVIFSGIVMFTGWIIQFKVQSNPFYMFQTYAEISFFDSIEIYYRTRNYGILICYAGLISLISLPVIRVLLTALLFIKQREYILAVIAFVVLTGLLVSLSLGIEI